MRFLSYKLCYVALSYENFKIVIINFNKNKFFDIFNIKNKLNKLKICIIKAF